MHLNSLNKVEAFMEGYFNEWIFFKEGIILRTEIHEHFKDMKDFTNFWKSLQDKDLVVQNVLSEILNKGIYDPLWEIYYPPNIIQIMSENYRETILAGKLISRTRAVLCEYKCLTKKIPILTSYNHVVICSPEGFTPFALYMRGVFPRFIGSEYGVSPEQAFPIPVEDLRKLSFNKESFHCIIVNDVFEHIPFVELKNQVLPEIYRILKSNGVLLSTFPFASNKHETIKSLRRIHYLTESEYHKNPVTRRADSLVFPILGWDILDMCKDIGFADVYMSFIMSARYGVLSPLCGVFVLVAIK